MLNNIVIGTIEDQISLFLWSKMNNGLFQITDTEILSWNRYNSLFTSFLFPFSSHQPLSSVFFSVMGTVFDSSALNISYLLLTLITLYVSYLLFKTNKWWLMFVVMSVFNSYFWLHLGVHFDLFNFWTIILGLKIFIDYSDKNEQSLIVETKLGLYSAAVVLISSYLGMVWLLTLNTIWIWSLILKKQKVRWFLGLVLLNFVAALTIFCFIMPYVYANYFRVDQNELSSEFYVNNSIGDFVIFSSRPWYHFLPSEKNLFFGSYSHAILERISSSGYFLNDDYFPAEHPEVFFGNLLLFTTFLLVMRVLFYNKMYDYKKILVPLFSFLTLFLFTLPPYFTISGFTIYTPGYLLFLFLPMLRVTSRLGVAMNLLLIWLLSLCTQILHSSGYLKTKLVTVIMSLLVVFTLAETFIPPTVHKIENPPDIYLYLSNLPYKVVYAVYPYSQTNASLMWLFVHKQYLINPRGYRLLDFNSEEFTAELIYPEGVNKAKLNGVEYIVVFDSQVGFSPFEIMTSANYLTLEKVFDNSRLYKIK